jgi:hypothetical protein
METISPPQGESNEVTSKEMRKKIELSKAPD